MASQRSSSNTTPGQKIGCGVGLLILLMLLLCGAAGYIGWVLINTAIKTAATSGLITPTPSGSPVPITTTPIDATITYSSVDITILNVQQATRFDDDALSSNPVGVARLNIQEHNGITSEVVYNYQDIAHLILPNKRVVAPINDNIMVGINQKVTRKGWIDFPISINTRVDQLTLRLGADLEAQMDIPLVAHPDLSQYTPGMINPNKTFIYAESGLQWTLTMVTSSLSAEGKQADKGMRFIVLTLKVDNPTSDTFIASPDDYMRLKSDDVTSVPRDSTLPVSFDPGTSGKTGTATFQMPQSSSYFTLVMLAQNSGVTTQATEVTTNFRI